MGILVLSVLALNDYASSTVGTSFVLQEKIRDSRTRKNKWKSCLPTCSEHHNKIIHTYTYPSWD